MTEIFDISCIESGDFKVVIVPLSLNSILKTACDNINEIAAQKNIVIDLVPNETEITINGDEYCLRGAISNILQNSIKFSNHGTIKISLNKQNEFGSCIISDEGIGISEDYQKHLFEVFSQEDVGYSRAFDGTGLGLALTKKYIEFMNGEIQITSKKDIGTTVRIKIPLYHSDPPESDHSI